MGSSPVAVTKNEIWIALKKWNLVNLSAINKMDHVTVHFKGKKNQTSKKIIKTKIKI